MRPQTLLRRFIVVMVAVPGRASLLGGGDCVAPMVPEPIRAGIPGLIKPVCLLLTQVICFRDQKQNTINPWAGCRGGLAEAMQENQRVGNKAISRSLGPQTALPHQGPGRRWNRQGQFASGPTDMMPSQPLLGYHRAQGPTRAGRSPRC
jgi:hypothetical protein